MGGDANTFGCVGVETSEDPQASAFIERAHDEAASIEGPRRATRGGAEVGAQDGVARTCRVTACTGRDLRENAGGARRDNRVEGYVKVDGAIRLRGERYVSIGGVAARLSRERGGGEGQRRGGGGERE